MPKTTLRDNGLACAYARDSGGPGQERSIAEQRAALEAYAAGAHITILLWYCDEALSGRTDERPEFQCMVQDALQRGAQVGRILVWDLSRIGRNEIDRAYYSALLAKHGVEIVSITQPMPDTPASGILREVIAFTDAEFSRSLARNVKRGHLALLAQGYIPGTAAPVGYRAVRTRIGTARNGAPRYGLTWEVDADLAPLVQLAFSMRASGSSIRSILAATHLTTTKQGLHHVLHNPAYKGVYVYAGAEYPIVPPSVDVATWEAAQVSREIHPRTVAGDYLLTGLLRCGYCGAAMSGFSSAKTLASGKYWRKRYYICTHRNTHAPGAGCAAPLVDAAELEAAVKELVYRTLLDPEPFAAFLDALRAEADLPAADAQRRQYAAKVATLTQKRVDLVALAGTGLAVEVIAAQLVQTEQQLRVAQAALAGLGTPARILVDAAHAEQIRAQLVDRLGAGDVQTQRFVLREVLAALTFGPTLTLTFRLP